MSTTAPARPPAAPARGARAARRAGVAAVQLVAASLLVFTLTTLLPGDTAEIVLGPDATDDQVERLRTTLGTDRPPLERLGGWAGGLLRGDLGDSLVTGRPVVGELVDRLGATALLGGLALLVTVPLAVAVGVVAGRRPGGAGDRASTGVVAALQAAPEFALGLLLVGVFSLQLGWLPATAGGGSLLTPAVLVLPVAVLVSSQLGRLSRQIRLGVVQTDRSPHVAHLRRLGLPEGVVLTRHVLPGAVSPSLQQLARVVDGMLGGVVVVEALFALPGVGAGFVQAVQLRDLPMIQGYALLFAATTIGVNLVVDVVAARLTPTREEAP
ncbi:ABC transporter permease [Pseudonocardia alni]|uniref:Peptide/nickel transport system permease protein n=1 Tax=Pseudonocardia alni TaxID=33907 RepID=A0AA44UPP9_PSEA5|nr:ABC transporter permease [Pseudonocardia alni]PKB31141.1 peptide/nickel transport system permease protein [Pseudonocardia alni]